MASVHYQCFLWFFSGCCQNLTASKWWCPPPKGWPVLQWRLPVHQKICKFNKSFGSYGFRPIVNASCNSCQAVTHTLQSSSDHTYCRGNDLHCVDGSVSTETVVRFAGQNNPLYFCYIHLFYKRDMVRIKCIILPWLSSLKKLADPPELASLSLATV